jgi:DNA-binding CsgD family transcriptional regulator
MAKHSWPPHGPQSAAAIDEALGLARQAGDAVAEAAALPELAIMQSRAGDDATALESVRLARAIAGRAGAYEPLLNAVTNESHVLEGMGEHQQAAEVARAGIASAEAYGLARSAGTFLAINMAEPLVSLGRWDEALEVIEHALAQSPPQATRAALQQLAGEIALRRGDLASAVESAVAARSALGAAGCGHGSRFQGQYQIPLARLDLELRLAEGKPTEALVVANDVGGLDLADDPRYAWPLLAAAARAVTAARQDGRGDRALAAQAADLLARVRALAAELSAFGPVQQANRLTFRAEALRAERAGHPGGENLAAFDDAAAAWERIGQPYPQADALLRGAEAALASGDRDGAAERLRRAGELADRLGARPLAREIAALARSARIRSAGEQAGRGAAAATPLGLTAREFEVLRLVAEGRSNPEIAARLFISAKTASVHVSNILAKVGVASRGEAAAEAHRLHLFDPAGVS